jgi:hypothetical protein
MYALKAYTVINRKVNLHTPSQRDGFFQQKLFS